jgi:hypothetical protein
VQNIQLEEDVIIVTAKDEFRVAEVEVWVLDAAGSVQERGNAVSGRSFQALAWILSTFFYEMGRCFY